MAMDSDEGAETQAPPISPGVVPPLCMGGGLKQREAITKGDLRL